MNKRSTVVMRWTSLFFISHLLFGDLNDRDLKDGEVQSSDFRDITLVTWNMFYNSRGSGFKQILLFSKN